MTHPQSIPRRGVLAGTAALAATGAVTGAATRAVSAPFGTAMRRGIGLYHPMGSPQHAPNGVYAWPPYTEPTAQMSDREMVELRRTGFDFVRMLVAPDILLSVDAGKRRDIYGHLDLMLNRLAAAGLGVVVDLHPRDSTPTLSGQAILRTPELIERYATMVGEVAALLAAPRRTPVALELFNEPPAYTPAELTAWAATLGKLHDVARAAAPNLTLVLSGGKGGTGDGLTAMDPAPYRGSNVMWTFHYYEPHPFTHQGANAAYHDVKTTWPVGPADRVSLSLQAQALAASGKADLSKRLMQYAVTPSGPEVVAEDFARVRLWARRSGVAPGRVLLGEFGVNRPYQGQPGAAEADRLLWLSTVRTTAERAGFPWAMWCYSGPVGMALANEFPAQSWDGPTLRALGLSTRSPLIKR